ncbi:MAG: AAA family ATPase [Parcubacteria group bacterium]|nr:AAA family ATPase [Parcubacteria group bacterium]
MEMDLRAGEPIVESILDPMDKVLLVARYKGGKSVWAQQLAQSVGGGHEFIGFRVPHPQTVLYVAGEGDLDELQDRAKAMSVLLPVPNKGVYVWPIPELPFNVPAGQRLLLSTAESIKEEYGRYPNVTIFDPVYSLMVGSMKDDEAVGRFLRVVNLYQALTHSAVVLVQHTHRTIRVEGEEVEELSEGFFGSMLWKAWPRRVYYIQQRRGKVFEWSTAEFRRKQAFKEPIQLTMIEPYPLAFVRRDERLDPTMAAALALLGGGINGISTTEITHTLQKDRTTVTHALNSLEVLGEVESEIVEGGSKKWRKRVWVNGTV